MKLLKLMKHRWRIISAVLYPLIAFSILVILWQTQVINKVFSVDSQILPQPFHIIEVMNDNLGKMADDIWSTLSSVLIGL